jgi:hypothetical protein
LQLGPLFIQNIEHESLPSHRVLSGVASGTTEQYHLLFGYNCDRVAEPCLRNFAIDFDIFDALATSHYLGRLFGSALRIFCAIHHNITSEASRLLVLILAGVRFSLSLTKSD